MRKIDLQEPKTLLNQKEKQKPFPLFLFPFYFIILILIIIGGSITAQVIIKEKVEITPQVIKAPGSPSQQQHTIMFNMQWDKPNREGLLRTVWLPCKDNLMAGWSIGGNLSLSIDNAQPGGYMFQVKVNLDVYEVSNVNYTIFLDGILARSGSVSLTGSSWDIPYYNINYSPPLISNYSISYQNKANMCYLDSKNISIYQSSGCPTVVSWNPSTEPLTLTIESGSEFVSFYDQTNNKLGDNFTGLFTEASSLLIKQDSLFFGSENKSLILSCDWAGIIHKDSSADIVSINPDDLTIGLNTYTNDTIYSGEIISCDISFGENAGCSSLLPQDQTYSVEITNGLNNGNLINPMSGEKGKKIDALDHWSGYSWFDYIADGNSGDSLDSVIIKVRTSFLGDKSSEKVIYIKPPPLKVIIDPPQLAAGDTADIIIKKRNPDGSLEDFPQNQEFEIAKLEGCLFGDLLIGDSLNYYFADAKQPVKFVVADSLVSDSGVVKLRVGLVENYESINQKYNGKKLRAGKYLEQVKEEWRLELEKLFAGKRNKTQKLMSNGLSSSCFIGDFITYTSWQGDVPIGKPELEIIYPTPTTTEWITPEPRMPTVICKAQLKNYNKGQVTFEWEYWVRYTLYRHDYGTADTLCQRTGMIKITGTSNSNNTDTTLWFIPFKKINLDSVEFKAMLPIRPSSHKYGGNCDEKRNSWTEGEDVFIGGDVFIKVTAKNNFGKTISLKQLNGGIILGSNPNPQEVQDYANSRELRAIIYHESLTNHVRWVHFNSQDNDMYYPTSGGLLYGWKYNKKGYPTYGVPNGYGLAKLDNPPPTETDLWNWKRNVETSRNMIAKVREKSNNYIVKKSAKYEEDKFWMNAFQMYNGGIYWIWKNDRIGWIENPNRPANNYGKILYQIYQELN